MGPAAGASGGQPGQPIHNIEQRQKVDNILDPNARLETPNDEIERIRTADLPSEEVIASYEMTSEPEELPQLPGRTEFRPQEPAGTSTPLLS